ncbi:MAG: hypothetical protein IIB73_01010 [Proteobacteria bacterium]|nr:hypothetical protein [Pseudomonadota bacterium]
MSVVRRLQGRLYKVGGTIPGKESVESSLERRPTADAGTLAEERKLFPAKADGGGRLC